MSDKNLLIVESPAKAKTIENYLGKDFVVRSCYGHVRDLDKKNMGIDVENHFQPTYIIQEDKKKVIKELEDLEKKSNEVWLATDEDREGEAISWHLCEALGLDPKKTKRIVFHEITKRAIQEAIKNPRFVDMNLVNAQQARRILDRIVGFELSPLLSRKTTYKQALSAGRVQSVAVKILVEREKEIKQFEPSSTFKIEGIFEEKDGNKKVFRFKAKGKDIPIELDAKQFLQTCKGAKYTITDLKIKDVKRSPVAPFSTSTLQQEASKKLGHSVSRTMIVAQQLYEQGFITYMRTDSVTLSDLAKNEIREFVLSTYGKDYHQERNFTNKNTSAQEAHEAIRPTDITVEQVPENLISLYSLIRKRTLASQMTDAEFEKTQVHIEISTNKAELMAIGEVLTFDGFMKVYAESTDDDDTNEDNDPKLPPLQIGQKLNLHALNATQRFQRPPARYSEAALVKRLEELGIGRPSTYAPTISTIQKRTYVEKRDNEGFLRKYAVHTLSPSNVLTSSKQEERTGVEKGKLVPTDLGVMVTDFLSSMFTDIMNYEFTASIENDFDKIAQGKLEWSNMLSNFYSPFKQKVKEVNNTDGKVAMERELGTDPTTGKKIIARMGAYGPLVQIGEPNSEDPKDKPKYSKLQPGQSLETITLNEALVLFQLPRNVGMFEDNEIIANIGRFGPYLLHNKLFYSIPKGESPYSITEDRAKEIILAKREVEANKLIKVFEDKDISILNGRYGAYIKQGKENYKLPKEHKENPAVLSLEDVLDIIEEEKKKPKKAGRRFKASKK